MLVNIFVQVSDFCKFYDEKIICNLKSGKRNRKSRLNDEEIITILLYFGYSGYKNFKAYYTKYVIPHLSEYFPGRLVSYNRFIEIRRKVTIKLIAYSYFLTQKIDCTGISFIDSTPLKVCHLRRQHSHKVMKNIAKKGKTSTGWFYGLKFHAVISDFGEILSFVISPANISDANKNILDNLSKKLWGDLVGDKGYLGKFKYFHQKDVHLITKHRKNMKKIPLTMKDKILLKKRPLIESTFALLKDQFEIEHTRHRSFFGFIIHIFAAIAAYMFYPKKPSIYAKI